MAVTRPDTDLAAQLDRVRLESDTLYAIIAAASSSADLSRVLEGVVELLTEATSCHACFVYIRDDERLRLRAASKVYAHLVGEIELGLDESLAGWVARRGEPAVIREGALADPRSQFVPELDEERFQSMVAVPVPARSGEVIGVVVLHSAAPREFDDNVLNFLVHTASLVAGAIENARLYEEARGRVEALTGLAELSQRIVAVAGREELYAVVTDGVRRLLGFDACQLHLRDGEGRRLELVASDPPGEVPSPRVERRAALPGDRGDAGFLVALRAGPARPNVHEDELLQAVANQVALALGKAELIERLTAGNLVRDMFEALAAGALDVAEARARAAACDLDRPHVLLHVSRGSDDDRAWPALAERVEGRLRTLDAGALCDAGRETLRALLPLREPAVEALAALRGPLAELGTSERVHIGMSAVRSGSGGAGSSLREAADAARVSRALAPEGGALMSPELGAYRYLVNLPLDSAPHDRLCVAVEALIAYDERRRTHLLPTLEQYLADRRRGATTARRLFIHPNTLRQRLDRIEKLTGLHLGEEDLLSLELAVKLVRLRRGA